MPDKQTPDLPSLMQRRKNWHRGFRKQLVMGGFSSIAGGLAPLVIHFTLHPLPTWLLIGSGIGISASFLAIITFSALRDYPTTAHIEFDQRIRRIQGLNDRVACE